jgi:hypothetical protein
MLLKLILNILLFAVVLQLEEKAGIKPDVFIEGLKQAVELMLSAED